MTLHDIAEQLRKVAYDMDEASRRWDQNDRHVENLNATVASLTTQVRLAREARDKAQQDVASLRLKLARKVRTAKRPPTPGRMKGKR